MDSPPETSSKEEHPQKERPTSEVVEVIMETEAEAGASGYSVIGGGERGIFVNEVLRDSPAAKNLSLQKGDQLLSARVYFDNVRYEDALKILQCAEPYKISFFLKRTVAHNEDTVHPAATNVDLKGPKAKMQKMSVKSTKPFKAKKKRGGRFGLKRLKENKQARVGVEVDTDGSPDRLEQHPVDVEFSLPRLKLKKGDKTTAEGMGKAEGSAGPMGRKKSKIRFPRMRVKGGGVGVGHADTNVATPHGEADVSGETGTGKGKGDGLRIVLPKTKKAKVEVTTSEDPQEIAVGLPSGKGGATGSAHDSGSGAKLRMPKLKLPKVRLSRQSDEIDGTANVEGPDQTKLKMPSVDVTSPRVEMTIPGDDEAQARQSGIKPTTTNIYVSQRDIDLHFPKVKGWIDLQDKKVGKNIKDTDIKCSTAHMQDVDLTTPTLTTHSGDEIDGTLLKGAKIKAPQLNVSFPKLPEGTGKVSLPSLDISLPNHPQVDISLQRGRPEGEAGYAAGSVTAGKLTMPTADVSLPSLSGEASLEGLNVKAEQSNMPSVDISLPLAKAGVDNDNGIPKGEGDHTVTMPSMGISPLKGKAEGDVGVDAKVKGEKIKLPGFEVSLQNITPEGEVNIKGPEVTGGQFHLPSMDIAISKGEAEGYGDTERHFKGGEFKLLKTDISLSKLPDIDMSAQKPDVSVGDVSMPSIDISMPKGIDEGSIDVSGKVRAGKFNTPSIDVSLPKRNTSEGGADAEGLGLKGGKISVPSIHVSTPKISMKSEVDASSKDSGFNMPSVGVSIPGIELPEGYISNDGPEIKGGNINMPKVNISHPNINTGGDADLKGDFKGPDMKVPTFNVSFPKSPEGEAKIDCKHGKIELPTIDLAPKKGKAEGNITIGTKAKGGKFKMPKVSMPKFKSSKGDLHVEGPELKGGEIDQPTASMSVPEGGDGQVSVKAKGGKFKMPTFDICLPKVKSSEGDLDVEGPEIQGGKIQKLPKDISLPKGAVEGNIDVDVGAKGSDSKIKRPTFDASLPKVKTPEGTIDIKGPEMKSGKFGMPSVDLSLPKTTIGDDNVDSTAKRGKMKFDIEGPHIKGGKINMPSIDISLPKEKTTGNINVDAPSKDGKLKMPTFDVSLPNFNSSKGEVNIEGTKMTKGKLAIPSVDISLPKGKVEGDMDVDVDGKGGKFKMPTFDVSLPKFKSPEGKIDVKGPDLKGPELLMPSVDVSLPKGNIEGGLGVDVDGKGGKLKMPTFGASLPKIALPKVDIEGQEAKGGKFNMPSIDFSLSTGKAEGDVDSDGTSKGGKFKMPTFDVSLPKFKSPEGRIDVESHEVKGGNIHMPSVDVSLPKGKVKGDLDVDVDGKGGKFKMPTFDVSLPKFKSPEGKIDVEGPDLKGPELQMPSVDVSLPKGNIEGGLDVDGKGGKLKMPTFDASLPKITMPKVVMEGPDAKGGKFNMPTVDFSLSKGKAEGDVDVDGTSKGGKFKMPSLDVSLPKFKSSGKIDVKGPEIKGEAVDMPPVDGSLPKGKVEGDFDVDSKGGKSKMPTFGKVDIDRPDLKGGKISMPTLDISLPQGKSEGEIDFDATAKGGKFKMPTLNVSLPSMRSADGKTETEGPDVKGVKLQMQIRSIDLSLSKGSGQGEIFADEKVKGGKIKKPVFDVSLPNIRTPGGGLEIDGQNNGGEMTDPSLEMSMSKGSLEGDLKAKGGRFKLPSVTISLPKVKKSQGNAKIKGPEVKDGNIGMSETDISLQTGDTRGNANLEGNTKGGKLKMPSFDMSLPKLKSPQGKADIKGPEVKGGELQMPLMDMSVQKGSVDTNVDVGAKGTGGKLMLPTCDVSLPGFKSTERKIDIEGPNFKGGKIHMPSVDMSSPRVEGEVGVDIECKDKGGKLKMPTFEVSLPKLKPFEGKIDIEGPELKDGSFDISSTDILLPKGKMGGDIDVKATAKGGKFKMPTVDVSLPKFKSPEGEIDIKGPRLGGDLHMPSIDISLPKGKAETDLDVDIDGTGKGGKLKMPTFDVSLPKLKSPEGNIYIEGPGLKAEELEMPSCEGDVNVDINGKAKTGKFKMPTFDVSLPKFKTSEGKIDITGPEIKTETPQMPSVDIFSSKGTTEGGTGLDIEAKSKGGKLKMPTFDVSLPKFKSPDGKLKVEGLEGRRGKWEMPSMDISTPKGKIDGKVDLDGTTKEGKFQIPSLDVSLPKFNVPEGEVHIEGPNIKGGKISSSTDIKLPSGDPKGYTDMDIDDKGKMAKFKMPHLDVSLPKFKSPEGNLDIEGSDVRDGKMHMPSLDIELPKGTSEGEVNVNVGKGGKFKMPEMDTKLPSFHAHGGKIDIKNPEVKGGKLHMPSTDISLPKGIAAKDTGVEVDGRMKGGKLKMPTVDINLPNFKTSDGKVDVEGPETKGGKFHMPSLDVSLPKGSVEGDLNVDGKGGKLRMPTLDLSLPKIKSPGKQVDVEGPELKDGKISMPSIDISRPKGKGGDVAVTSKGGKLKMATFDVSLPTIKSPDEKNKIEGPDVQGGRLEIPSVDISSPKSEIQGGIDVNTLTKGGKFKMPTVDISLPKLRTSGGEIDVKGPDIKGEVKIPSVGPKSQFGEAKLEGDSSAGFSLTPSKTTAEGVSSGNIKLPNMKLPTVNISAPKVDLDFGLQKSKETDREDIELLQAEEGRPSSGASFEVPDVTVKMPKFSLSKISGKSSGGDVDLDMCGKEPEIDLKGKSSQKDVDQNIKIKGKKKKHKIKIPFFGTPKKDVELNISRGDRKEKELDIKMPSVEISLPATKTPEHEVLLPKTEVDVSEADIRAYEGSLKIPKMPSIGISVPKVDLDVSLPTLKHGAPSEQAKMEDEKKSNKGKTHLPTIDISVPKGNLGDAETEKLGEGGKIKIPDVRMPSIDISLPKGKSSTMGKTELEPEEGSGKFKLPQVNMPSFDVSNPKIKGPDVNVSDSKEGGGKTKMPSVKIPTIDISLSKGRFRNIDTTDVNVNRDRGEITLPNVTLPTVDLSLPHMKTGQSDMTEGADRKGGKIKGPEVMMPTMEISTKEGDFTNINITGIEKDTEGRTFKVPGIEMPAIDVSLPSIKDSAAAELNTNSGNVKETVQRGGGVGKFSTPSMPVEKPKLHLDGEKIQGDLSGTKEGDVRGDKDHKGIKIKLPTIGIEAPKGGLELDIGLKKGEKKKDCKKIELPDIDLNPSMPKSKVKGPKVKGTKFKIGMPKMKNNSSGIDVKPEGEEEGVTGRFKVQKTKIGKDSNPDLEKDIKGQGNKGSLTISEPSIVTPGSSHDIHMPRIPELDFDIGVSSGIAGGFEKDKSKGGKINLSKSGINVKGMSKSDVEMDYEGPKMPKVTKAVFVLVNPAESTGVTKNLSNEEHGMNAEGGLIKVPMTEMKAGTGKFHSKGKEGEEYCDEEGDGKSKAGKLKIPKVGFSPGKSGSFDVRLKSTDSGREEVAGLNGEKDSSKYVKLKMPKIEFTSPYSKSTPEEERLDSNAKLTKTESDQDVKGKKSKSGKIMFSGFKSKTEKTEGDEGTVVCSTARTEMLTERESSESPPMMYSTGVTSVRQREHESSMSYSTEPMLFEREGPSWRDIPRLTLTSQSGGLLQITPEGSPHGIRSSLQHSGDEASGGFQTPSPRMQMTSQGRHKEERIITTTSRSSPQQFGAEVLGGFHVGMKLKEEVIVTTTKEEIVTVVTKTSKHDVTDTPEESSIEKKSVSPKPWEF